VVSGKGGKDRGRKQAFGVGCCIIAEGRNPAQAVRHRLVSRSRNFGNIVEGKGCFPPLLGYFLQELLTDETKQVSVGQCIVQAAKSQAVIPPLLLGLGVAFKISF
jgi:hypothetical protein